MRTINAFKAYEQIQIPFANGETLNLVADLTDANADKAQRMINKAVGIKEMIDSIEDETEQAKRLAEFLSELVILLVGEDGYRSIITACGVPVEDAYKVNFVVTIIWSELCALVQERLEAFKDSKASHYLQTYNKANK